MNQVPLAGASRQRVPSALAKIVIIPVALLAIACLLLGLHGGGELLPSVPRFAWFAAMGALFAVNFLVRQALGYDVCVDAQGIRETRRGGANIAWAEKPECSLATVRLRQRVTPKGAVVSAMANAAQIQTLVVATPDGRRIEVGLVLGSPIVAAVRRFAPVAEVIRGDGA